jgi:hypothetical protein
MGTSTEACGCVQKSARVYERVQPTAHMCLIFGNRVRSVKGGKDLHSPRPSESFWGTYVFPHPHHARFLPAPTRCPAEGERRRLLSRILHCTQRV